MQRGGGKGLGTGSGNPAGVSNVTLTGFNFLAGATVSVGGAAKLISNAEDNPNASAARLFPNAGPDIALDLVDSRADSKRVTIQVYRPTGRPQYATATADHDDE